MLEIILDDQGNFPDRIEWGWRANRPILLALYNYAVCLWQEMKWKEAKKLLPKLLEMNPRNNTGVRFVYLAIIEGIAYIPFKERFKNNQKKLIEWFREKSGKYEKLKAYWEK